MKREPKRSRWKQAVVATVGLAAAIFGCFLGVSLLVVGDRRTRLVSAEIEVSSSEKRFRPEETPARPLVVMTLNLAHGRKEGPHQLLQSTASIRSNLDDVAAVILREKPDVVALQEADGPSIWSGRFNHVDRLARSSRMGYSVRAENVKGLKLSYGTALLSRWQLEKTVAFTFAPSPPTFSKGFIVSTVSLPGAAGPKVDVVSVHLDFFRGAVRARQVAEMVTLLATRENPLIVMGDFNCQWTDRQSPIRTLGAELGLKAYRPESKEMGTFGKLNKRLDWILISEELEFVSYTVLPDAVSDHRGVIATIRADSSSQRPSDETASALNLLNTLICTPAMVIGNPHRCSTEAMKVAPMAESPIISEDGLDGAQTRVESGAVNAPRTRNVGPLTSQATAIASVMARGTPLGLSNRFSVVKMSASLAIRLKWGLPSHHSFIQYLKNRTLLQEKTAGYRLSPFMVEWGD